MKTKFFCGMLLAISLRLVAGTPETSGPDASALKWDAELKEYALKPGETSAAFTFVVTNVSKAEVAINRLHTSCGCTVAQLPATPYKLQPGSNVAISVAMDLRGKSGVITKTVTVESTAEGKVLLVRASIPTDTKLSETK
jgi:methionine aminopeptidase